MTEEASVNDVDFSHARWRKSSRSSAEGQCVEVADGIPSIVPVRDSKTPHGQCLTFGVAAWTAFMDAMKTEILAPRR